MIDNHNLQPTIFVSLIRRPLDATDVTVTATRYSWDEYLGNLRIEPFLTFYRKLHFLSCIKQGVDINWGC